MQIPWENSRVLLYRGRGLVSSLIRWQTRSPYTHAAILMPDGRVIESREGKGVQIVEAPKVGEAEAYRVIGMTPERWRHAIVKAQHELGSGYDWKGVLQFVSRREGGDAHRWFCSEFVYHVLHVSGVTLLERTRAELISPGGLESVAAVGARCRSPSDPEAGGGGWPCGLRQTGPDRSRMRLGWAGWGLGGKVKEVAMLAYTTNDMRRKTMAAVRKCCPPRVAPSVREPEGPRRKASRAEVKDVLWRGAASYKDVAMALGVSEQTAANALARMVRDGVAVVAKRAKAGKGGHPTIFALVDRVGREGDPR